MFFIYPHFLWLLLLLVPLVWQHQRHRTSLGAISLWSVAGVRALAVMALIIALARPVLLREEQSQTIVHVVDVSAGVDRESLDSVVKNVEHVIKKAKKQERHKIVLFAQTPWQVKSPALLREEVKRLGTKPISGSNLAAALDLAATLVQDGAMGEVRLYSDGRATAGNTMAAVQDLARRGMLFRTIVTGKPLSRELILSEVQVVSTAMLGETLPVRVVIEATDPGVVRLVVTDAAGEEVLRRQVSVTSGRQTLNLTLPVTLPGTASFEVRLEGEKDTLASNNQKHFAVEVLPAYRVGLIGTSEAAPLAALLGPSSDVRELSLESLKAEVELVKNATTRVAANKQSQLEQFDLIVLADTPAESLGPDVEAQLAQAVEGGCGMLVTGGKRSFGPGGYLDGPLAQILPVRSIQKMEQRDPSATLVIIIDTSGSMGRERVQLAKEIARLAIRRLKPHDKAGVVEFYGAKRWAAPIQPASNAIDISRALNRLSPGGGTVILPAIEETYFALLNVRTRTRHVLVLTDGGIETGAFEPLIRKMTNHGITLSTVLVGPGTHSTFLTRLAQWGRGKSYHAPSRFNLPEILVKQPESSLLSPWIERPTQMVPADRSVLTDAINFNHAPLLTGYVETEPRRTVDVLIRSTLGHPILTRWQYGLGHVATVTTQLAGPWSKEIAAWDGYGPLMAGLARSLARQTERMPIQLNCTVGPEGLTVLARATTANPVDSTASLVLTATNASNEIVYHETLEPTRPGVWLMRAPLTSLLASKESRAESILHLEAKTSTGTLASGAVAIGVNDEFCSVEPEGKLMKSWEQACRKELTRIKKEKETVASQAVSPMELRSTMVTLALILFLLQVAVRRLLPNRRFSIGASKKLAASTVAILVLALMTTTATAAITSEATTSSTLSTQVTSQAGWKKKPTQKQLPKEVVEQVQKLYKSNHQEQARSLLKKTITQGTPKTDMTSHAARLAWICGDAKTTAELLTPSGEGKQRCREELLLGSVLLETGRAAKAIKHFQSAYQRATTSIDRRFAMAMHVQCARKAKTLDKLANQWLAQKDLPQEKLQLLVQILGELDRYEDAFQLLERPSLSDELSEDLQKEVVSLAIDAGKTDRATAVYRQLLTDHPRHTPYLSASARLYLLDDRRSEAVKLFDGAILATDSTSTKSLFRLATSAADLSLYDQARAALDKAAQASETARVTTVIKKADLARREGKPGLAIKLLASLRSAVDNHPKQLLAVAEAYERYGDSAEAFTLLKRIYELTGSEDILAQVAWLSEESNQFDEAYEFWLKLWRQTKVTARRTQAKTRLLDLASRTGKLVDMVIDIEEKLDENRATREEIMLLVDIYAQTNDPISASEILFAFGKKFGDERETAKRLVRVYFDCDLFARADTQLHKMIEMDPENAMEYLEQIAMLAIERGRPYEAFLAVKKLNESKNSSDHLAEFSAGVFELLGMYDEAIAEYEKSLAQQPDHIEILLLWGRAMKLRGKGAQAVQRMLDIAKTCEKDDQFVIAIDGLLNLEAKPNVLREALAMIERRIAADGDKIFLYDLAIDLLDNLGESSHKQRVLQQSLIEAGMRRPIILRQLMDEAALSSSDPSTNRFIVDHGRILLMLGDEVPPAVFLQIGKAMLDADDTKTAATIFRRASVHGDFADIGRRVASLYVKSGRPKQAKSVLQELLITEPDAVDLLIQAGKLSEQAGRLPRAFEFYLKSVNLLLDRVPPVVRSNSENGSSTTTLRSYYRARNLSELDIHLDNATLGLIFSARSEESQASVIKVLIEQTEQELADLKKNHNLKPILEENPRLAQRIKLLRRIAFALHSPNRVIQVDRAVLASYPKEKTLLRNTLEAYIYEGFFEMASSLADSFPKMATPQKLQVYQLLKNEEALAQFLANPKRSSRLAKDLLPILLAKGRAEDAKRLLAELPVSQKRSEHAYLAANTLDDPEALADWAKNFVQNPATVYHAVSGFRKVVEKAWFGLDKDARETVLQQITTAANQFEKDRNKIDILRLELAGKDRFVSEVLKNEKLLASLLVNQYLVTPNVKNWFPVMTPEQRLSIIKANLELRKKKFHRSYLLELLCSLDSLDDAVIFKEIVDLFKTFPPMRMQGLVAQSPSNKSPRSRQRLSVSKMASSSASIRSPWYRLESSAGRAASLEIAEYFLKNNGPTIAVSTLHAIATARVLSDKNSERSSSTPTTADPLQPLDESEKFSQGREVMLGAINRLLSNKNLNTYGLMLLQDLLYAFPASDAEMLFTLIEKKIKQDGMTVPLVFAQAWLHEKLGNTKESLDALHKAFALAPDNPTSSGPYISAMRKLGRNVELIDFFSTSLGQVVTKRPNQYRTLSDLYRQLFRFEDTIRIARKDNSLLSPIQIIDIETARGNPEGALYEIRLLLIQNRKSQRFYLPTVLKKISSGGLKGFLETPPLNVPFLEREHVFKRLADQPYAVDEWGTVFRATAPDNRDMTILVTGYVKALLLAGKADQTLEAIRARQTRGVSGKKDHLLWLALQSSLQKNHKTAKINPLLGLDEMLLTMDWSQRQSVTQLARILLLAGKIDEARHVLRWAIALGQWNYRTDFRYASAWDTIDLLVETYPEKERHTQMLALLKQISPSPVNSAVTYSFYPEFDKQRFQRLFSHLGTTSEMQKMLEREVVGHKQRLFRETSHLKRDSIAILATLEASLDQFDAFRKTLKQTLDIKSLSSYYVEVWDYRSLLPPAKVMKQPVKYLTEVVDQLKQRVKDGEISEAELVRALCLLANWQTTNKVKTTLLQTEITKLANQMESAGLFEVDPSTTLWLIDYYQQAGDTASAYRISKLLLEKQTYPPVRFPWLLGEIKKREGKTKLKEAIKTAKSYSDHPILKKGVKVTK